MEGIFTQQIVDIRIIKRARQEGYYFELQREGYTEGGIYQAKKIYARGIPTGAYHLKNGIAYIGVTCEEVETK